MKVAPFPIDEVQRQEALDSYEVLDTPSEFQFDQLTRLASEICGTKISLISLIDKDRQWFKSHHGLDATETPRSLAFCAHAVYEKKALIVEDATKDPRFSDNPLVTGAPNVIFYAGVPLIDNNGFALGTLCAIDHSPKTLSQSQMEALSILAEQVVAQLRLKRKLILKNKQIEFIKGISDTVPGLIYQYRLRPDGSSHFPFATDMMQEIYELSPSQVVDDASLVFSRIHPEDLNQVSKSIQDSANNLSVWSCEFRVILPNKGTRWLQGLSKPHRQSDQSIIWHGFTTDITDEKNWQMELQQNSKMAALGAMASGMAHEINNPISIITGTVVNAKRRLKNTPPSAMDLESIFNKIESTALRIAKIVHGLRNFSRDSEKDPYVNVPLESILNDLSGLIQEKIKQNGIELQIDINKDVLLYCNSVQITQVLFNLVTNSFHAIQNSAKPWIKIQGEQKGNQVLIEVSDSGPGIPGNIASKMMEPFFTTKPPGEGTGLGLSVSRGLIEAHGGKFTYLNQKPNTTFLIALPTALAASQAA